MTQRDSTVVVVVQALAVLTEDLNLVPSTKMLHNWW